MRFYYLILCFPVLWFFSSCQVNRADKENLAVPVLSPEESMRKMKLPDDLSIKLVASEPLLTTPISMTFDDKGRIWVVEMTDFHPIREDSTQQYPLGDIVILEDTDGDGVMDKRTVFLDSLVLPRALRLVGDGILVSSPPNLWYYDIDEDRPSNRVLVDSAYIISYNVEGQTNGLLRGMDNWIYSAGFGSSKRYRRINGEWVTQKTFLRGQWGITQDNYGRLFYNNNSQNLLGDYLLPGVTEGNKYLRGMAGYNKKIVPDNRVYPIIPTPGVNRGYKEGILDDSGRLVSFTAGCGPLIYRGGLLPEKYNGNAFVCEPAAYLIKRNILHQEGVEIKGKQAGNKKEFLASADERFRPVSLYDGPDGALYVVDMYRGVIQDNLSITDYLKDYSLDNGLNHPINCGRIYKIIPKEEDPKPINLPNNPKKLLALLGNENGWIRDHAQQKIVDYQYSSLIPELKKILLSSKDEIIKIHALWTLEGLGGLSKEVLMPLFNSENNHLRIQSLAVLTSLLNESNYENYLDVIKPLISESDSLTAPYIAFVIGEIYSFSPSKAFVFWDELLKEYSHNKYVVDAIIGDMQGKEERLKGKFPYSEPFSKRLKVALEAKDHPEDKRKLKELKKKYEAGYAIYEGFCQTCHGADGNGIDYLAPPLNGSEWVVGDKDILLPIILYGLTGPVEVKGKIYKKPTITGDMPPVGNKYPDEEIAEVISFIRQAWNNDAEEVTKEDIQKIKKEYAGRDRSFTAKELLEKTNSE